MATAESNGVVRSTRAPPAVRNLERGSSAPIIIRSATTPTSPPPLLSSPSSWGHEFKKKTFYKLTHCQHCTEMLWGIKSQGYICTVCNFVCHERCLSSLTVDCIHLLSEQITNPIGHTWIGPKSSTKKKKWCNVCRKKINGSAMYCKVCRLYAHKYCVGHELNNCKECATYTTSTTNVSFDHHWIEGNLTSTAKCELCTKPCFTDLCLTGYHCGWCGITLHSSCFNAYKRSDKCQSCGFRDLCYMMLPSYCVYHLPISRHTIQQDETVEDVTELFSDEDETNAKSRPVIVIDGRQVNKKWKKRTLHPIHVDNKMKAGELLRISLRKCSIPLSTEEFYLTTSSSREDDDGTASISGDDVIYNIPQSYPGPLKLYIKKRETSVLTCQLRVYNSRLSSSSPSVNITIEESSTVSDIVKEALILFQLHEEDPSNYSLNEISQSGGVIDRVLPDDEKPWKEVQNSRKDSLKSENLLRYYLCRKEKILCSFYIWKVDSVHLQSISNASQYIMDCLSDSSLISSDIDIGPVFSKLGGFFVNIDCPAKAEIFYNTLSSANCRVSVIPTINEEMLSDSQEPILVFINGRSGGNQGVELINGFSRHLNPLQVYDLSEGGPLPGLYSFRNVSKYRVLVGGGDGTVGWVLSGLDCMKGHLKCPVPPCAVLPLGTGNDLARALKWGGGYTGEKVMQLLYSIEDADCQSFDRWNVEFKEDTELFRESELTGECKTITMNNYLGIGLDAEIALDFHQAREDHPEKFNSRLHNKGVYLQLGVQKTFSRDTTAELHQIISLKVDDKLVRLPIGLKGIVLLNIESWGAGSEPWGNQQEEGFVKNSFSDGILEVMGLSGPMHLGRIKSSLQNGIRIAQGSNILITMTSTLPVQIDGEAWQQTPGIMEVSLFPNRASMLSKSNKSYYQRGISSRQARSLIDKNSGTAALVDDIPFSSRRSKQGDLKKGSSASALFK